MSDDGAATQDRPGPQDPPDHQNQADGRGRPRLGIVAVAVFLMYAALNAIVPLVAPLARTVGLPEWQIGAIVSVTALVIAVASPLLGRTAQRVGPKRMLVAAMLSGCVALIAFAASAQLGISAVIGAVPLFWLLLLTRSFWFGLSDAAAIPTAQTYVASVTPTERERTAGMARIGAAAGAAMVLGPVISGLLGAGSMTLPFWVLPVLLLGSALLVAFGLPGTHAAPGRGRVKAADQADVGPEAVGDSHAGISTERGSGDGDSRAAKVGFLDRRVWPYLLVTLGLGTALGFFEILLGFIVQDRLHLSPDDAILPTGLALLAAGVGIVVSQAVVVPRLGWRPGTFIRFGAAFVTLGYALLVVDAGYVLIVLGTLLTGFGMGLVQPSVMSGVSLAVGTAEQGSAAGLIGSANGATYIVAPIAGTLLYGAWHGVPLVVSLSASALILIFVLFHSVFKQGSQHDSSESQYG